MGDGFRHAADPPWDRSTRRWSDAGDYYPKELPEFPCKEWGDQTACECQHQGGCAREFEIELAETKPDFWVFLELGAFRGKQATIEIDALPENSPVLDSIEQGDQIKGSENLYREALGPSFISLHAAAGTMTPTGWCSSRASTTCTTNTILTVGLGATCTGATPSAVIWCIGENCQSPFIRTGSVTGPFPGARWWMTGTRRGLPGVQNRLSSPPSPAPGRGECIVFSNDRGRTWTEYTGNPVVKHAGRDPRLLWYAPSRHWVMAVYDEFEKGRYIAFYTSTDLKNWQFQSRIEGFFECPDLFELPLDGDPGNKKWVLSDASSHYMVGSFDGKVFTPETPNIQGHRGDAFYAAQTFSNIPSREGRCIQIGWGRIPTPGMPFNQMMFFPCRLALHTTPDGPRLAWQPVHEVSRLVAKTHRLREVRLRPGEEPLADIHGDLFDIRAEFEPKEAQRIVFDLGGIPATYDATKHELLCQDCVNDLPLHNGRVALRILLDRASIEVFGDDGLLYMPMKATEPHRTQSLGFRAEGGEAFVHSLEVDELRSAWERAAQR